MLAKKTPPHHFLDSDIVHLAAVPSLARYQISALPQPPDISHARCLGCDAMHAAEVVLPHRIPSRFLLNYMQASL